jgi:hypothetical protein
MPIIEFDFKSILFENQIYQNSYKRTFTSVAITGFSIKKWLKTTKKT